MTVSSPQHISIFLGGVATSFPFCMTDCDLALFGQPPAPKIIELRASSARLPSLLASPLSVSIQLPRFLCKPTAPCSPPAYFKFGSVQEAFFKRYLFLPPPLFLCTDKYHFVCGIPRLVRSPMGQDLLGTKTSFFPAFLRFQRGI